MLKQTVMSLLVLFAISVASPVHASTITLDFSGTVDLSALGGAAANSYSGSVTWDPTASPFAAGPESALYAPTTGATFVLNSTDLTASISSPAIEIYDFNGESSFDLTLDFSPHVPIPGMSSNLAEFAGRLVTFGADVFPTHALPSNLDFVGSLPMTSGVFYFDANPSVHAVGSFNVVPEPTTLTLTALGLAGVATRYRRRQSRS